MLLLNLDLLATASGGVARLRELILTLAVQGKLVSQDPAEESASALLQKIRAKKDRLIGEGKIKRDKPVAEISDEEKPFRLPAGWVWVRFGDASINRDAERIPVSSSDRETRAKTYDYYGASGVIDKIDGFLFDKTLLLIGEDGANLINRSTPIAFLAHGKYWVNNHAHVIDTTHPELMTYLALSINAISLEPYVTGTAQPKMNQAKLNGIVIALPPLAEQCRIVARVEELMRLCDALEAKVQLETTQHAQLVNTLLGRLTVSTTPEELADNWQRVSQHFDLLLDRPEAIDALEQTLLQLAVRGLLVHQDASDEPASTLLARIRFEKDLLIAEGKIKRDKPLPPITEQEQPFELPVGWEWARLGEIMLISSGVTLGRKTAIPSPVTLPYLRVANVQRWHLNLSSMKEVVIDQSELERFQLLSGDLLITEGGDWDKVGRTAIWRNELEFCLHQNHVFKARGISPDWNSVWAELYLNSGDARVYFASSAKQTTNLASINMTQLKNCAFPVPPIAEQSRIVTRVTALRRLCADLRQRLKAAQATQSHLAQALVESSNAL
ncbi:restriction endonuclease subunit S [Delftia sp. WSY_9]|uniref:restriction endonuclease subunit S n=1 Tax=unclassified Delftia TaxID=2613839 RepID=UPI00370AEB09